MNMMNNLFSMFDPSSYYMSMGWLVLLTPATLIFNGKCNQTSKMYCTISTIYSKMEKEIKQMMSANKKMSNKMTTKIFMILMSMNFIALYPFNFTTSAHISISFWLSLSLWASVTLYGWMKSFNHMMSHLTPLGTPPSLMNFMVMIEMVSNLIRPITLSIRLTANMVAGHLLMSLLSNFSMMSMKNTILSTLIMTALSLLEMMVAMVQAYVLTTLITLYQNESMK